MTMDEKRKKLLCDILAEADKMRIEKTWLVSEDELEEHSGIRDSYEFGFLCGYLLCKEQMMKDAFKAGSEWKENLELTWEDMFNIFRLVNEVLDDYAEGKTKKEIGEEVLKRFKKDT